MAAPFQWDVIDSIRCDSDHFKSTNFKDVKKGATAIRCAQHSESIFFAINIIALQDVRTARIPVTLAAQIFQLQNSQSQQNGMSALRLRFGYLL